MSAKKIVGVIFGVLLIGVFIFCVVWTSLNFSKVKDSINGSSLYSSQDLEKAKMDGYNEAMNNKAEYEKLIKNYKNRIAELNDQIPQITNKIVELQNETKLKEQQINDLKLTMNSDDAVVIKKIEDLQGEIAQLNLNIGIATEKFSLVTNEHHEGLRELSKLRVKLESLKNEVAECDILDSKNLVVGKLSLYKNTCYGSLSLIGTAFNQAGSGLRMKFAIKNNNFWPKEDRLILCIDDWVASQFSVHAKSDGFIGIWYSGLEQIIIKEKIQFCYEI
ncbi:MAG: hypothetical protein RSB59_00295 [Clostridia bacterium]